MVRPMVHSIKHYLQFSIETVTGGAVVTKGLATGVAAVTADNHVLNGSTVKAIYVEIWARAGSTTPSSGQFIIYKKIGDSTNPSTTDMAALHDWDNKKNILYTTMGLFNDQDADAIMVHKGWVKIPKGKQRMGLGDSINFSIFTPTIDLQICGFATYKEYN